MMGGVCGSASPHYLLFAVSSHFGPGLDIACQPSQNILLCTPGILVPSPESNSL